MLWKGHGEEQIVYALCQAEAGNKVGDICREVGVSLQAFTAGRDQRLALLHPREPAPGMQAGTVSPA